MPQTLCDEISNCMEWTFGTPLLPCCMAFLSDQRRIMPRSNFYFIPSVPISRHVVCIMTGTCVIRKKAHYAAVVENLPFAL
jgi:hypothetical protein